MLVTLVQHTIHQNIRKAPSFALVDLGNWYFNITFINFGYRQGYNVSLQLRCVLLMMKALAAHTKARSSSQPLNLNPQHPNSKICSHRPHHRALFIILSKFQPEIARRYNPCRTESFPTPALPHLPPDLPSTTRFMIMSSGSRGSHTSRTLVSTLDICADTDVLADTCAPCDTKNSDS